MTSLESKGSICRCPVAHCGNRRRCRQLLCPRCWDRVAAADRIEIERLWLDWMESTELAPAVAARRAYIALRRQILIDLGAAVGAEAAA